MVAVEMFKWTVRLLFVDLVLVKVQLERIRKGTCKTN